MYKTLGIIIGRISVHIPAGAVKEKIAMATGKVMDDATWKLNYLQEQNGEQMGEEQVEKLKKEITALIEGALRKEKVCPDSK